jgi:hypothetical protein
MEELIKSIDFHLSRVEQILPTLPTREEMHRAIAAAVAPLATKQELAAAVAPLATKSELAALRTELLADNERTRARVEVVFESVRDEIRILAEGIVTLGDRVDRFDRGRN